MRGHGRTLLTLVAALAVLGCTVSQTISPPPGPTTGPTPTRLSTTAPTPTGAPNPSSTTSLTLDVEPLADGFQGLTFLTNAGDGTGRLYAVEQRGVIWTLDTAGHVNPTPFLDITDRLSSGGERGLLGLAFHPGFAQNGRFFVDYTDLAGNTVVSELGLTADGSGDAASERRLLGIAQPFPNHNGGMLAFGSDGYLYIGAGDGGSAGDPLGNGQNWATLLGKILRVNIDSGDPYAIPDGNPFPPNNHGGALPEIWDYGMRNPWRFSFDRATGALWIGDVGQDQFEEIDVEPAGSGGHDYGWNIMEATHCYAAAECARDGLTLPVAEYSHLVGCSITGGYVYRGAAYPQLVGQYVFADYCTGHLWTLDAAVALASGHGQVVQRGNNTSLSPTSFGEDETGELYLVNGSGQIFRLVAH
jgi:glucose/arabinose dehydrogenase